MRSVSLKSFSRIKASVETIAMRRSQIFLEAASTSNVLRGLCRREPPTIVGADTSTRSQLLICVT